MIRSFTQRYALLYAMLRSYFYVLITCFYCIFYQQIIKWVDGRIEGSNCYVLLRYVTLIRVRYDALFYAALRSSVRNVTFPFLCRPTGVTFLL